MTDLRDPRWKASSSIVTCYHGTAERYVAEIRAHGLISKVGYDRPQWYMLADDYESAAFHAGGQAGGQVEDVPLVVLEFHVPSEPKKLDDGTERKMWPGFPYLWKAMEHSWEGHPSKWYALRQPLKPEFLKKVHPVKPR